jgi:broad specificity phosphatase PhoE
MKQLYFVRHGLSEMNEAGLWSGQTETPLSDKGRLQAKQAGERAKSLGIDHIIASPYSRTVDTATIIAEEIGYPTHDIVLNSLFIERGLGVLEGQPWQPDLDMDGFADVETSDTLFERMHLAYKLLKSIEADTILVVSHGATGRALRHIIHPEIPFQGPESNRFPNAKIVQLI